MGVVPHSVALASLALPEAERGARKVRVYIVRRFTTGNPSDEPPWLPNKEMTKLCEVSDETWTDCENLVDDN